MSPSFPPPDMDDVNNDAELDQLSRLPRPALLEFAAALLSCPTSTSTTPRPPLGFSPPPPHEARTNDKHEHKHKINTATAPSQNRLAAQKMHTPLCSLCPCHAKLEQLDAELVGFCLGLVEVEVSVRCDVVRGFARRFGRAAHFDHFPSSGPGPGPGPGPGFDGEGQHHWEHRRHGDRMRSLVNTLSGVATLFLSPSEFERYYGGGVSAEHSFERVESGCAACVLAVVGSRQEVLVALRANIKAREKGREPRLLALVEAWMQIAGREEEEREMKAESDTLAEEVRQVRRWMHARRVERRGAEHDDGTRGRSKHRGGLPAGTRIVGGVPMPQVRLHWDGDRQHYDSYRDSYPVGGLDGAEDFEPPSQDEARPEDDWPSGAPPRAPSPFTDDGVGSAGEYAPSHNHRYHEDRPNAQIPEPLFRRRQQHGGESVRDSLDVFSTPKQTGAEGHGQPSQQSTDWGDFYI